MGDESLPPILQRRVAGLAGARPVHARLITGGLTLNRRWEVTFDNGTTAFLKVAVNNQFQFLASSLLNAGRYDAVMDCSGLTREQAERLRQQIQRHFNYMNSLFRRMEKLRWLGNSVLVEYP